MDNKTFVVLHQLEKSEPPDDLWRRNGIGTPRIIRISRVRRRVVCVDFTIRKKRFSVWMRSSEINPYFRFRLELLWRHGIKLSRKSRMFEPLWRCAEVRPALEKMFARDAEACV